MHDADIVRGALGAAEVQSKTQAVALTLVYLANAEPVSLGPKSIELYQALLQKARAKNFGSFTIGELKVFLEEERPGQKPAQIVNSLEKNGLLAQVSGVKSSRSDPPMRAVVRRPVCESRNGKNVFTPVECLPPETVEEPVVAVSSDTPASVSGMKTKPELEQDLAGVEAQYAELEDQWEQERGRLEGVCTENVSEITRLRERLEVLEREQVENDQALEAHQISKPEGLDDLRHKKASLQKAIDVYDEIAPLFLRS